MSIIINTDLLRVTQYTHVTCTAIENKYAFDHINESYSEVMRSYVQDLMLRLLSTRTSASPSGMSAVRTKSGRAQGYIFSRKHIFPNLLLP